MNHDILDRLAESEVPPLPAHFDRSVHQRLNQVLLVGQAAELLFRTLPYALAHFAQGVIGAVVFTLSGQFPVSRPKDSTDPRENRHGNV